MRYVLSALVAVTLSALSMVAVAADKLTGDAQWIWYDAGDPAVEAPAGKVWFRLEAYAPVPSTGAIKVVCDDKFIVWVNGHRVGEGDAKRPYRFNLSGIVDAGTNVIAIEAENKEGKAGLLVTGGILFQNTRSDKGFNVSLETGPDWRATTKQPEGDAWLKHHFDDAGWEPVRVIGPHETSPWKDLEFANTYLDRYEPASGFQITRIAEPELVGSLVNMTWGNRGQLIASRELGPILSILDDDNDGIYDRVIEYSSAVKNCQGLCMVFDELYAVGQGPSGVGIYRLPDANHDGKADDVRFVTRTDADMSEHGPHDVMLGPDGWMYFNQGNKSHIKQRPQPTSPVRNYYEGYLLEPKFEDARGHAAGFKAPGGTIWRFSTDGQWWLETSGFRNEYDFAFNSLGDAFSYDADMEWDVSMPWYRPTRVMHCVPGAEFGWRSGVAKWPDYYFDSLPSVVDVGRGSPTGIVFYEHEQLPAKYRGSLLICDWSLGRIMAVPMDRVGATFQGPTEVLLTGNPLNVTDIEVDRDGSIVFTTGGRNSEGGIYRLSYIGEEAGKPAKIDAIIDPLAIPQLQSAWARERIGAIKAGSKDKWPELLEAGLKSDDPTRRARALVIMAQFEPKPTSEQLIALTSDPDAKVRGLALWMLGSDPSDEASAAFTKALKDSDPHVQRRACEAFVRSGLEAPVDPLLELLAGDDRFLRFAARLALERVPVDKWRDRVLASDQDLVLLEGLLALYRTKGQFPATDALQKVLARLVTKEKIGSPVGLAQLRMIELALLADAPKSNELADKLAALFPSGDKHADMELARILARLDVGKETPRLIEAMETSPDQAMQIHLALCLRYLSQGWTPELKARLLDWFEKTKNWEGGASFGPYLANIVSASFERFTPEERKEFLFQWQKRPFATQLLIERSKPNDVADYADVATRLFQELTQAPPSNARDELVESLIASLGQSKSPVAQTLLTQLYEQQPDYRDDLAQAMAAHPTEEYWPYLVRTLSFANSTTQQQVIKALSKLKGQPEKADDYRALILAGLALRNAGGMAAANLLAKWTDSPHAAGLDVMSALAHYQSWYREKFPDAQAPELPTVDATKMKYTFEQLTAFLDSDRAQKGDPTRGQEMFTKANCIKCHQFGKLGKGIGPDLSSVRRRFQKREIVESLLFPSKVVSDQYRSMTIITNEGEVYTGIPVKQITMPGVMQLLTQEAKVIPIQEKDIDEKAPASMSLMPEGLLNELSIEDIADLFAFLETSTKNEPAK